MRKIVLLLCLAAIIFLSGCIGFYNQVPNFKLSANFVSKVQNNMNTNSFEGFTSQSTFGDVLEKIKANKINTVNLAYNSVLLGYPSVNEYVFSCYKGDKLLLDFMSFDMLPDGQKNGNENEDLLSKLDAELGKHIESSYNFDKDFNQKDYTWNKNGLSIEMSVCVNDNQPDITITVCPSVVLFGKLPSDTPNIFPYRIGTDFYTIYSSEKPSVLPDNNDYNYLEYKDGGIEIKLQFKANETGIRLCEGTYDIYANNMGFKNSLTYFNSLADGLDNAIGSPLSQGYGIPNVDEDGSGMSYEIGTGGQSLSSQDILDSGKKYYWLDINWPGIQFDADYGSGVTYRMEFSEEYIKRTVNRG